MKSKAILSQKKKKSYYLAMEADSVTFTLLINYISMKHMWQTVHACQFPQLYTL